MRLLYFADFSEQFPYRLLRGIYRHGQQNNMKIIAMPDEDTALVGAASLA